MLTKPELRQKLKQARLDLSDADHTLKSRGINDRLRQAVDWSKVKNLHYFEPLGELLEPDTTDFLSYIEDTYPNLKLFTPRKVVGTWELIAARGGEPPKEFDVVIVPMLGFDPRSLHRIGYGGGYYDKFLVTQPHARKIGLCFELGKTKGIPVESHDVSVDVLITEKAIY